MHFLHYTLLYIDPGTGSLLIQVLSGALITFLMFFKKISLRLSAFFSKKEKDKSFDERA
jgi:hypothetical protein